LLRGEITRLLEHGLIVREPTKGSPWIEPVARGPVP